MFVLINTQGKDIHVDTVIKFIKQKGGTPVIFERYNLQHGVLFEFKHGRVLAQLKCGRKKFSIDSHTLPSVWWRSKPFISSEVHGSMSNLQDKFRMHEWRHTLSAVTQLLSGSKWVNDPYVSQRMSLKIYQLKLAAEFGIAIPSSIITNDAKKVLNLFNKGRVIYKTLSSFITEEEAIYTNEIIKEDVTGAEELISLAPGIFQQLIEKEHELRVTIIGDKIFTRKIHSQKNKKTKIDWRKSQAPSMFTDGVLSKNVTDKLMKYHRSSGLIYAAYDFIVDKEGREIFLECNPGGQWFWKKDEQSMAISEAIANQLMRITD